MSAFGHNTFKDNILRSIIAESKVDRLDIADTISEVLVVIAHLVKEDYYQALNGEELKKEALHKARIQVIAEMQDRLHHE